MRIELKKFGTMLSSREAGKDAYDQFLPSVNSLDIEELLEIDFGGLSSLAPSWGDEFLSPLVKKLGDRLILINTKNLSVKETIDLLEDINGRKFNKNNLS